MNYTFRPLYSWEWTPIPISQAARWTTDSVWTFRRNTALLSLQRFETRTVEPVAQSPFDFRLRYSGYFSYTLVYANVTAVLLIPTSVLSDSSQSTVDLIPSPSLPPSLPPSLNLFLSLLPSIPLTALHQNSSVVLHLQGEFRKNISEFTNIV